MNFILAITTFNRFNYLQELLATWQKTKSDEYNWSIVIADDGSTDGTINYLESLNINGVDIHLIKNNRLGVHQQVNSIIEWLSTQSFDFCFKVDDDIEFLKKGWDTVYFEASKKNGYDHLVFCESRWSSEQFYTESIKKNELEAKVPLLHSHGFMYTLTPRLIKEVGYFDVENFGFRGMAHVDYTARCCRAGGNDINHPYDIANSNEYITAYKEEYISSIPSFHIELYDDSNRERKEQIIINKNRVKIDKQEIDYKLFIKFQNKLIQLMSSVLEKQNGKKDVELNWYREEIEKVKTWYTKEYSHLPKWYVKIGKLFTFLRKK